MDTTIIARRNKEIAVAMVVPPRRVLRLQERGLLNGRAIMVQMGRLME